MEIALPYVRIGKSAECSSYMWPFSVRSAFGTHLEFTKISQ